MDKEDIIEIIYSAVAKKFGKERIKKIDAFGPYEGEDLNVIVYVEEIDEERRDSLELWEELFDMFDRLGLDVPISITRA